MAWTSNQKFIGLIISFLMHASLFVWGGFIFVKPIQYGVELGLGGLEVNLTAAPVDSTEIETKAEQGDTPLYQNEIEEILKAPVESKSSLEKMKSEPHSEFKGDGSSVVPGKDQTTAYSAKGAISEARPNYLKNPAPAYPLQARQNGWQGVVILKVFVDKTGHPSDIQKEKSSGYNTLDESALKTVRSWRFQPALLGNLPVESFVRIPIRFELNQK